MKKIFFLLCVISLFGSVYGQVPGASIPVHLDLGIGVGASMPTGTLNNNDNTGLHVGTKLRLSGFMPLNVSGGLSYHRLPNKVGSSSDVIWMAGAGVEYPIPSILVKPYFGVDALFNSFSNTAANTKTFSRFGAGIGAGVSFAVPAFGDIDASVKYQLLNLAGKDPNEDAISQISANISLMFSIL